MHFFEGQTANEAWLKAASFFRDSDSVRRQSSRAGDTREILGAVFTIREPTERWIVSRSPAINPAFALAEVVWILSGRRDSGFLNHWNPKLPKFAGAGRKYHGAYGYRLRKQFGIDQLSRAYEALRNNPDSRQVVLQIWDPRSDFPEMNGAPASTDIPCNICSFAKIRDNKLEWTQILRSNDLFLGVPHNFVQFTSLQEILAGWLGVEAGHYRHLSDCLHVYERDCNDVEQPSSEMSLPNADRFNFGKSETETYFADLGKRMDKMTKSALTQRKLRTLVQASDLPQPVQNWLLVVAADTARRKRWHDVTYELMAQCTNPLFKELWDNWFARWREYRREEPVSTDASIYAQPWLPLEFA